MEVMAQVCEHKPALTQAQRNPLCSTWMFLKSLSASLTPHEGLTHNKSEPNAGIFHLPTEHSGCAGPGDEQSVKSLVWVVILGVAGSICCLPLLRSYEV